MKKEKKIPKKLWIGTRASINQEGDSQESNNYRHYKDKN